MQIIEVGVCIDNNDPKGLGRIRFKPYNRYVSEIEKSMEYTEWDDNDQFIALPFLPAQINIIPKLNQSIHILKHNTDKETQNVLYIAGPYGTPHNHDSETFLSQNKNTTYGGVIVKDIPDLKSTTGDYIDKKSKGSIANPKDNGFYGNYGSDLIFTENGLFLRGGKYISKETSNNKIRQRLVEVPVMSEKVAKIFLKKFPKTMNVVEEEEEQTNIVVSKIKYIIEYTLDDLISPTTLDVYVYMVLNTFGTKFNTNVFNDATEVGGVEVKLINEVNSGSTPTYSITIDSLRSASAEMREILHILDQKSLFDINIKYSDADIHPFYFRPTSEFKTRILATQDEKDNRTTFINSVSIRNSAGGKGVCYSKESLSAPAESKTVKVKNLKIIDENSEQSFGAMIADKMYLLSTNTNKGIQNNIDFKSLDEYELSQIDYLDKIEPNTYSLVRGETLIKILNLLYEFTVGHVHNINETGIYIKEKEKELSDLINTMSADLINKSIKIN